MRHIWIKPVLCSRMVSLFHHTSPWTHGCLQSTHSAQRNGRVFRSSVQTACCYWILNHGKSSSHWNSQTNATNHSRCRPQWSRCLRRESKAARLLTSRVRILSWTRMSVPFDCCVLSGRGLCVGLITGPVKSYRVWCVWVWYWSLNKQETLAYWWLLRHGGGGGFHDK